MHIFFTLLEIILRQNIEGDKDNEQKNYINFNCFTY